MQRFAIRLLLTSLLSRRSSKRLDGMQVITSLMTAALILFVGLYAWTRSFH
jgi:hypothetical protein